MAHDDPACAVPLPCMAHIFVGAGPRPARLICTLGPPYIYFMGMFRRQRAATHFANSGKVGKTPFKGEMFRFISPLKIPLFTDQSGGTAVPPYWMYPPGDEDEGRGRFSWRLTVPTPFVPLGHFPLTGGIGLGRRRGRGRARRVVAPHANDHCYLSCRAPEGRRVKDAAPYRFATFDTRRTTGEQPGQARLSG